ncbi:MAG: hypothetical protein JWM41_1730 [Gemmatimonadetes bacterium]|nr:hypothetical protein [Gemmatimonadota bacterium]
MSGRSISNALVDEHVDTSPTVLVSTWDDGLFVVTGQTTRQEFANQSVRGLASDGRGGALFIVGGHSLCRRTSDGAVTTLATSELDLACCMAVDDVIYVGTDDARLLCFSGSRNLEALRGFEAVAGRDTWYAGSAVIDGRVVGPPLGIRSMTATSDRTVLLVNVHVGGIPRSADGGASWQPTLDIRHDVHEVCAHPTRPGLVAAAAADGLHVSRDGGATWTAEQRGLHASYCSAVAFLGDDVVVAASTDHFASEGAIYRRAVDGDDGLTLVESGLPRWTNGIVDTGCISVRNSIAALVDRAGRMYMSADAGLTWAFVVDDLPLAGSLLIY